MTLLRSAALIAAAALFALPAAAEDAKPISLTYATYLPQSFTWVQVDDWFMAEVTRRTEGRVTFETFYAASLLKALDVMPGLAGGLKQLLSYNRQISRSSIYGGKKEDDTVSLVILQGAGNLLAIEVDQVIGEQEIVIKQIEGPIPKPAGIAGATVLGDGTIMPIGDVLELIAIAQGRLRTDSSNSLWQENSEALKNWTGDR